MKQIFPALAILAIAACSPSTRSDDDKNLKADSTATETATKADTSLTAKFGINPTITLGEPVLLTFTVYNNTDSVRQFCKWHTPFEPLMSKYLDVTASTGEEAAYKGPMAKRMMPPPADSYISIQPKDSLSMQVDLLKAYDIRKAGKYSVRYNSQGISGINVADSVSFVLR